MKGLSQGIAPVHNDQGKLLTTLPDVVSQWLSHYQCLAKDVTGNSQNVEHWVDLEGLGPLRDRLTELDRFFVLEELWKGLLDMKNNKSPGIDGITTDFLKTCLEEQAPHESWTTQVRLNEQLSRPGTPMSDSLLHLMNKTFDAGKIPKEFEDSVVVSMREDGDLADPGNHRGMSLMCTTLKVVMVLLSTIMNSAFEEKNLFSVEQAGFRRKEESIIQAATVYCELLVLIL